MHNAHEYRSGGESYLKNRMVYILPEIQASELVWEKIMNRKLKWAVCSLPRTMAALTILLGAPFASEAASTKPTIVLVHGAMADASSWNSVIPLLSKDG